MKICFVFVLLSLYKSLNTVLAVLNQKVCVCAVPHYTSKHKAVIL